MSTLGAPLKMYTCIDQPSGVCVCVCVCGGGREGDEGGWQGRSVIPPPALSSIPPPGAIQRVI